MTLLELSRLIKKDLDVKFMPSWLNINHTDGNRWYCSINHVEKKDGGVLISSYGSGRTPQEAIISYCKQISNNTIVVNAETIDRQEFILMKITYSKADFFGESTRRNNN